MSFDCLDAHPGLTPISRIHSSFSPLAPISSKLKKLQMRTLSAHSYQREMYIRLALGELLMMSSVS